MSALAGDITWGDIKRWESDAYWGIYPVRCACGGQGNDTLHDPETGEQIGYVCESCDESLDLDGRPFGTVEAYDDAS